MLSIIIPVYNVEKYLERCLQSIESQTLKDYEVIIINDGSTDNSLMICEKYAVGKSNVHIYSKENAGLMNAWMYGVTKASGDYIGFVDSDDYIDESMYKKMYATAKMYHSDIIMCRHIYENENGERSKCSYQFAAGLYEAEKYESNKRRFLPRIGGNYLSPSRCNKIVKYDLLLSSLKYCDPRISSGEDVNIITAVVFLAKTLYFIDEYLYIYCNRSNSISGNYKKNLFNNYVFLTDQIVLILKTYGTSHDLMLINHVLLFYAKMFIDSVMNSSLTSVEKSKECKKVLNSKKYINGAKNVDNGHWSEKVITLSIIMHSIIPWKLEKYIRKLYHRLFL